MDNSIVKILCIQIVLFTVALTSPVNSNADVYKWLDEKGRVQYGDRPPPEKNDVESVSIKPAPPVDASFEMRQAKQKKLLEVMEEEHNQEKTNTAMAAEALALRRSNCKSAQKYLADMLSSRYIYEESADPFNPKILTQQQRDKATANARKEVDKKCTSID